VAQHFIRLIAPGLISETESSGLSRTYLCSSISALWSPSAAGSSCIRIAETIHTAQWMHRLYRMPVHVEHTSTSKIEFQHDPRGSDLCCVHANFTFIPLCRHPAAGDLYTQRHNVYLHGTSSPQLFAEARRTFSHGCVRVANPPALIDYVLRTIRAGITRSRTSSTKAGLRANSTAQSDPGLYSLCNSTCPGRRTHSVLRRHLRTGSAAFRAARCPRHAGENIAAAVGGRLNS
jgi:hypothetical protein